MGFLRVLPSYSVISLRFYGARPGLLQRPWQSVSQTPKTDALSVDALVLPIVAALAGCANRARWCELRYCVCAPRPGRSRGTKADPDPQRPLGFHQATAGQERYAIQPCGARGATGPCVRAQITRPAWCVKKKLNLAPEQLGTLRFSWFVQRQIAGADVQTRRSRRRACARNVGV